MHQSSTHLTAGARGRLRLPPIGPPDGRQSARSLAHQTGQPHIRRNLEVDLPAHAHKGPSRTSRSVFHLQSDSFQVQEAATSPAAYSATRTSPGTRDADSCRVLAAVLQPAFQTEGPDGHRL